MEWITQMKKPMVMKKAAQALAEWIVKEGVTVEALEARIKSGERLFAQAIADAEAQDIAKLKASIHDVVQSLTRDDFWEILRHDALHGPKTHAHAVRLAQPGVWPYFERMMHDAKQWLLS